ncbi:hypothetical protein [Erwinia billingiae]|nr:hypothetical protein [Erwinia billingiae]
MNSRQRRALRYREACKKLDRQLTQALTGNNRRIDKALTLPPGVKE